MLTQRLGQTDPPLPGSFAEVEERVRTAANKGAFWGTIRAGGVIFVLLWAFKPTIVSMRIF